MGARQLIDDAMPQPFEWADELDGLQSGKYLVKLSSPIMAFQREGRSGAAGGLVELPPGEYVKGSAYITSGDELAADKSELFPGPKITPEIDKFLKGRRFFPLHPKGSDRSTTYIAWVAVDDLVRSGAAELTGPEFFKRQVETTKQALKDNAEKIKQVALKLLRPVAKAGWDSFDMDRAFDDFTVDLEDVDPRLVDCPMDDEDNQFIENLFGMAMMELDAPEEAFDV